MSPLEMTTKQISKLRRRNVSIEKFLEICARFNDPRARAITTAQLRKLGNGCFLGVHSLDEGKTYERLHLKTVWFKKYSLKYGTSKTKDGKSKVGDEIFISSFPLPRGKVTGL